MADGEYTQQFKKGSFEMIFLCPIAKKETYGYGIIIELNETGGKIFGHAKEGTICPVLYRLQDAGLVQCRIASSQANDGPKKYYPLTAEGRGTSCELISFWCGYTVCVDSSIDIAKDLEA